MKATIAITLSKTLLAEVDTLAIAPYTRSAIIEAAIQAYVAQQASGRRDAREFHLLNAHADAYNAEMADVMSYQVAVDIP